MNVNQKSAFGIGNTLWFLKSSIIDEHTILPVPDLGSGYRCRNTEMVHKIRVTGHHVPDLPIKGSGKEGGYMIRQKCIILASLWDHAFTSTLQNGEFLPFVALGLLGTLKDRHHLHKSQGVVPPKKQDHTSVLVSTTFKVNRRKICHHCCTFLLRLFYAVA